MLSEDNNNIFQNILYIIVRELFLDYLNNLLSLLNNLKDITPAERRAVY